MITSVRAYIKGAWHTLAYDGDLRAYRVDLEPEGTTAHDPGGYDDVTVEVANDSGVVRTYSAGTYQGLRLVVREQVLPGLALVSPPQGWVNTATPQVVVDATDEGSGIVPGSLTAAFDGQEVPVVLQAIENGWRASFGPNSALSEGPHAVTVTVADADGNTATLPLAYSVDTVPPEVEVRHLEMRHVIDGETVEVVVRARDATSGVEAVTLSLGGQAVQAAPGDNGRWRGTVPVAVGVNDITATARDASGLTASQTVRVVRLVTDRTARDTKNLQSWYLKGYGNLTEAERAAWDAGARGAYGYIPMDRVGYALEVLEAVLRLYGQFAAVQPYTAWSRDDAPTEGDARAGRYLPDVAAVQAALPAHLTPPVEVPGDLWTLDIDGANRVERALVHTDEALLSYRFASPPVCGLAYCGD